MIRTVVNVEDKFQVIDDPSQISDWVANPTATVWVDILDPDSQAIRLLKDEFHFHPLSLEDVVRAHQRPKIDIYANYYFLVFYTLDYPVQGQELKIAELDMFLGPNYLVTAHAEPMPILDEVWSRWQRRVETVGLDIGALLYEILDHVVDDYFPVIDALAEEVEGVEARIFEQFDKDALEDIFGLKKEFLALRRIVAPERDVVNVLLRRDPPILPAGSIVFFQDVYDHLIRVLDSIDTYRDLLSSALDAYLSVQSNNLNEIMRRLTIISTIFLPLTFITGFFGMNFEHLPFANPLLMWLVVLSTFIVPLAMLFYFRWQGWD